MLAIDVSISMDTRDFYIDGYTRDRLTAARATAINFIKKRPNDRIGIVGFAGKPYVVSSLTTSHSWLPFMIEKQVQSSDLLPDGTGIGSAIKLSAARLTADKVKSKSKIIVLLTDGESNSGMAPLHAAKLAKALGIKIYTIAIGTEDGRLTGHQRKYFDPETLKKIAKLTDGQFFVANTTDTLDATFDSINQLEKVETKVDIFREVQPYHFYFSILALVVLSLMLLHQSLHLKNTP